MSPESTRPRPDFAARLENWFVAELSSGGATTVTSPAAEQSLDVNTIDVSRADGAGSPTGGPHRKTRSVFLIVLSAAAIALLVAALSLTRHPQEIEVVRTAVDVEQEFRSICEAFYADPSSVPRGAEPGDIGVVVEDLTPRLERVKEELGRVGSEFSMDVSEQDRLTAELVAAVKRLGLVAEGNRDQIDQAVSNFDLILVIWGDRMDELAGSGCGAPPTLREVR